MKELLDIVETMNTKVEDIKWTTKGHINKGIYKLGDDTIEIYLEEYETKFGSFVDFGFAVNGSIQAQNNPNIRRERLIGSVLNGAAPMLIKLDPDVIMVSVNKGTGMIEGRKSLYATIISWFMKRSHYTYRRDWVENSVGFYSLIAKHQLSDEAEQTFINTVKQK